MTGIIKNLKNLEVENKEALKQSEIDMKALQTKILRLRKEMGVIQKQSAFQKKIREGKIRDCISDHAVLRILERKYGFGEMIKNAKEELALNIEQKILLVNCVGDCRINLSNNLQAVIKDGYVVTVKPT